MRRIAMLASTLVLAGCAEPECPVGTYKIRNICRRLDAGAAQDGGATQEDESDESGAVASGAALDAGTTGAGATNAEAGTEANHGEAGSLFDRDAAADAGDRLCDVGYVKESDRCRDLCAGACDPMATCNATSGTPICSCPASYATADSGKTCTFDASCSALKCDANATCAVSGATRTCTCQTGYSGNGTTCANTNECAATPPVCGDNSTCTDTLGSYMCGCQTNYKRVGNTCVKNPCAPNPCANGGVCSESTSGTAMCACTPGYDGPTCAHNIDDCASNPCQNGGTCSDALDGYSCACTASYTGTRCELEICGDTTIRSATDLTSNRLCKEVRGNLTFVGGATSITSSDLPYLTRVTGNLTLTTTGATAPFLETINLGTLQTIEGSLQILANSKLTSASFPALTTLGRPDVTPTFTLQVQQSTLLGHLDMPALTTIYGNAQIAILPKLCSANVRRVTSVTGAVTIMNLINLPYTSIKPLVMFASSATATNVGCCTTLDTFMCNASGTGTCLSSCP